MKRDDLCAAIDSYHADITVLTETWLWAEVNNSEIFQGKIRFNTYCNDREERCSGGVLIAVAESLDSYFVHVIDFKIIWIYLSFGHKKFILICCYRPPSSRADFVSNFRDVINNIHFHYLNLPLLLLSDFNFPNRVRSSATSYSNPRSSECSESLKLCTAFNLP